MLYTLPVLALFALIGLSIAYDFSDIAFNNYLYEQINQELNDDFSINTVSRNRRGLHQRIAEKCSFHSKINCCGDTIIEVTEEHKEIKKRCFAEYFKIGEVPHDPFSCESILAMKKKLACALNCHAEAHNWIQNGEPNADAVKSTIISLAQEDWQKAMVVPIVDKCVPLAKEFADVHPAHDGGCSLFALKFVHCLWRTLQLDCPADKLQTTAICTTLIEVLKANNQSL